MRIGMGALPCIGRSRVGRNQEFSLKVFSLTCLLDWKLVAVNPKPWGNVKARVVNLGYNSREMVFKA